jgi:Zn-dependent peptidase ImmA (M78 family)/DNA-binding XRE family transcriptional regulator
MAAETRSFNGARLRLARALQSLSQAELADRVAVSQAYVHHLEAGSRQQPTPIVVQSLAEVLGVPAGFLHLASPRVEFRDEECAFRRRASTSLTHRLRVLAHGTLFAEALEELEQYVDLPEPNVPQRRASTRAEIEDAAEMCRKAWGIPPDAPIANVVRVFEHAGIVVTRFEASAERIDAFSRVGDRDVIVLNTDKRSTSRARFDCAHEAGHLVMHRGMETGIVEREDEANYFAAAFMLPRRAFAREFGHQVRVSWEHLKQLKARWRVSLAAMVRRAYDLQLIGAAEYRRANMDLKQQGWHLNEPDEPPDEPPELFAAALDAVGEVHGLKPRDLAAALGWSAEMFEQVTGFLASDELGPPVIAIDTARRRRRGPTA